MAAKDKRAQYEFRQKQNETLIKEGDDLNGASFSVADLKDCSVYLLGFTQQVQVDDCDGCRIFIGPCDGSVFIRDCTDCVVSVAARQLRLRDCQNIELGVYCSTQPALESSKSINFTPWMGAYPGLTGHFSAANLDPTINSWDRVYDFTPVNAGETPNWTVQIDSNTSTPQWWEVDVVEGIPDNPVPLPDGQVYQYRGPKDDDATVADATGTGTLEIDDSQMVPNPKPLLGNTSLASSTGPSALTPIAAWRQKNLERLELKQQDEADAKAKRLEAALEFRQTFDQERMRTVESKKITNREEEQLLVQTRSKQNPSSNPWECVVGMIDFDLHTHTVDVSRFKSLLFAAKSRAAPAQ
ncbi:hypothetical protein BSKO_03584 [Bryopsis sp. KO-2023]|nr:hypothetical protein BSKO_03584 [Bryopsis sp. KO-2023]